MISGNKLSGNKTIANIPAYCVQEMGTVKKNRSMVSDYHTTADIPDVYRTTVEYSITPYLIIKPLQISLLCTEEGIAKKNQLSGFTYHCWHLYCVQEKGTVEKNHTMVADFKTLADVLIQVRILLCACILLLYNTSFVWLYPS